MSTAFAPSPGHPVLTLPTPAEALAMGGDAWSKAMQLREKSLREEQSSPLWRCWEPPIWKICDALWGAPWLDDKQAEQIRTSLDFKQPVNVLLMNGGWASSKSEYAANRLSRLQQRKDNGISWCFHETLAVSRAQQQRLMFKYLPPHLKTGKQIMERVTYVTYKMKTGFSDESYVLPNGHTTQFWTYDGGIDRLQGPTVSDAWADELITPEFVMAVRGRVSRSGGVFFITFAPIHGYSPTVQEFWDGAKVVRESTAFLNPEDGGPRDAARFLGLTEEEWQDLREWILRKNKPPVPNVPWSRPENCLNWALGLPSQPAVPEGRKFRKVPRVLKPVDPEERSAIVCFHGSDNPYGNPASVYLLNSGAGEELGNRYFYGYARKGMVRKFPKFDRKVHVIPGEAIPALGTDYLIVDPAEGRNFFMTWIRVTPKASFVHREWPGNYEIPEQGVPGPWAIPSGRLGDGAPGPGQEAFGYGLADYKREIARLEGWKDAEKWSPEKDDKQAIRNWFAENGAREKVARRFIDSRFASSPHMEDDRPVTLLENFAEMGLYFETTPGDDIAEGVAFINDLLGYDTTRPVDALNCPKFFISEECKNTIFALETWRNKEGRKGATKDPVDNLRYFALAGLTHMKPEDFASDGGGHY